MRTISRATNAAKAAKNRTITARTNQTGSAASDTRNDARGPPSTYRMGRGYHRGAESGPVYPQDTVLLLVIIMMLGASIDDLRRRRVDNRWWLPFLGAAIVLDVMLLMEHGVQSVEAIRIAVSIAACGLFYLMWRMRLFGGADAKGLMVLALLVPIPPADPATLPALDALTNGLLVALILPLGFAIWNLARGDAAFPAIFLGFRVSMATAHKWMVWPMQQVIDGEVKLRARRLLPDPGANPWPPLEEAGVKKPWVTPMIPFMIPLAVGTILAIFYGNLMVRALVQFGLG